MKRKEFIKLASTGALGTSSIGYLSCETQKELFFEVFFFLTIFRQFLLIFVRCGLISWSWI